MPSDVVSHLQGRLSKIGFRYRLAVTDAHSYAVLVNVEGYGYSPSNWPDLLLAGLNGGLNGAGSPAGWNLRCCQQARDMDVQLWLTFFREADGKLFFGDSKLPDRLRYEVSVVAAAGA